MAGSLKKAWYGMQLANKNKVRMKLVSAIYDSLVTELGLTKLESDSEQAPYTPISPNAMRQIPKLTVDFSVNNKPRSAQLFCGPLFVGKALLTLSQSGKYRSADIKDVRFSRDISVN